MIEKRTHFLGVDDHGRALVEALRFGSGLQKTASIKTSELHQDLQKYISDLKPISGKLYVLVNALGAGEYWGSNINADWFPEEQLKDESGKNGYKTFYDAGVFRHHVNSDKAKSFGKVVMSVWNDYMKRVELLLCVDKKKAAQEGHQDLIDVLDQGGHPAVSMGMRTPYDVCSVCNHQSKTTTDYCHHLKFEKGKVYPDGRKIYMINPVFKAFDISFVLIGADQTSFAIAKVASADKGQLVAPAILGSGLGYVGHRIGKQEGLPKGGRRGLTAAMVAAGLGMGHVMSRKRKEKSKTASVISDRVSSKFRAKQASIPKFSAQEKLSAQKLAEILKRIPMGAMQDDEPDLSEGLLNQIGESGLKRGLATSGSLGMVLKPKEFQRVMLISIGKGGIADDLDRSKRVFDCSCGRSTPSLFGGLSGSDILPSLLSSLLPMLSSRSSLGPSLGPRMMILKTASFGGSGPEYTPTRNELLDEISKAYAGYLHDLGDSMDGLSKTAMSIQEVSDVLYPDAVEEAFYGLSKTSGPAEKAMILGVLPAMYLLSKMFRKASGDKETDAHLSYIARRHPVVTTSVIKGLIQAL